MTKRGISFAVAITVGNLFSQWVMAEPPQKPRATAAKELVSGVERENFSTQLQPGDDFYRYVNEQWLNKTEIPADQARWISFSILDDEVNTNIRKLIEEAGKAAKAEAKDSNKKDSEKSASSKAAQTPTEQVGNLYSSFLAVEYRNSVGIKPIEPLLKLAREAQSKSEWMKANGQLDRVGISGIVGVYVDQDAKRSDQYAVHLTQSGLSLPDRDYYLEDENRYKDAIASLKSYIQDMLKAAGAESSEEIAQSIIDFQTKLAKVQWSQVELRDPIKTYNKIELDKFVSNHANLEWKEFVGAAGLPKNGTLIVGQPSFFEAINDLVAETDLKVLKAYTQFRIIDSYASALDEKLEKRHFDFHETALSGVTEQEPLWKRAVQACNGLLGMPVGQLYVAKHFSPEAKERMEEMVEKLKAAFAIRIKALEWMGPGTKAQALKKLSQFRHKIGYPNKWKDYSSLHISDTDLVANLLAISEFEHQYQLAKLDKPIDREEWLMPPQMVNAYYNPQMNEIVFPAGILQPPFFNLAADDAVNYGGIGAVIGHEISHGFDDQGSQYDGLGNLQDWWTPNDRDEFKRRTKLLVEQYSKFKPFPDMNINGELTLGENIGDLGGLNAAYTAYRLSLKGDEPKEIDGLTGDQRFFIGWAQVWRGKYRETELRKRLLTDPHSPIQYRANGIVSNLDVFYDAFGIKPGSTMYIEPEKRVRIW